MRWGELAFPRRKEQRGRRKEASHSSLLTPSLLGGGKSLIWSNVNFREASRTICCAEISSRWVVRRAAFAECPSRTWSTYHSSEAGKDPTNTSDTMTAVHLQVGFPLTKLVKLRYRSQNVSLLVCKKKQWSSRQEYLSTYFCTSSPTAAFTQTSSGSQFTSRK